MSNLATITNNILADSGIDDINVIVSTGSYANPAWITSLAWTKITGAPANIITGTGTTNYLPRFTGASTIGNSGITDDGATVTLLSRALSGSSANFSTTVVADRYSSGSTNTFPNVAYAVRGTINGNSDTWGVYAVSVTHAPSANNALAVGFATGGTINRGTFTGLSYRGFLQESSMAVSGTGTLATAYGIFINPLNIATSNYSAYFAQNVGIGNPTPSYLLDVSGFGRFRSSRADLILEGTSATEYSRVIFVDSNANERAGVQYINPSFSESGRRQKFELFGNNGIDLIPDGVFSAPVLALTATGSRFRNNLGVGGAAATYPLTVYNGGDGTSAAIGGTARGLRVDNDGVNSVGMTSLFGVDNTFYGSYQPIRLAGSTVYLGIGHTNNVLTVTNAGNILVGNPSDNGDKFQISGNIRLNTGYVQVINASNAGLYLSNTSVQWQVYNNTSNNFIINNGAGTTALSLVYGTGAATFSSSVTVGEDINLSRASSPAIVSTTNQAIRLVTNGFTAQLRTDGVFANSQGFRTDGFIQAVNLAVGASFYNTAAPTNGAIIQGNVGIGTSSPGTFLQVSGTSAKSLTGFFHTAITDLTTMGTGVGGGITFVGYKTAQTAQEAFAGIDGFKENSTAGNAAGAFRILTQPSSGAGLVEQMRITSSGNLGLGVTPSAWISAYRAFNIGLRGFVYSRTDTQETAIGTNWYRDSNGSFLYTANGFASYQAQQDSVHYWFNAPSGTAGNAISFTQAMTLFSTGNLLVGSPSPISDNGARLQVSGLVAINSDGGGSALRLIGRAAADASAIRFFANNNSTQNARIESNSSEFEINSISNLPITFKTNDTARLTIAASTGAATFSSSVTATGYSYFGGLRLNGADNAATIWKDSGDMGIYPQSGKLYLGSQGTQNVISVTSSSVGINNTNPQNRLTVNTPLRQDGETNSLGALVVAGPISSSPSNDFTNSTAIFRIQGTNATNNLQFGVGAEAYSFHPWIQGSFDNTPAGSPSFGSKDILLQPLGGNVGIGAISFADVGFGSPILKVEGSRATLGLTSSGSLCTIAMIPSNNTGVGIHLNQGNDGSFRWYQYSVGQETFTLAGNGNLGIRNANPQAYLDVMGVADQVNFSSLLLRAGNSDDATPESNQILFGYAGTNQYAHAIKTRHQSGFAAGNTIEFWLWQHGDSLNTPARQRAMIIDGNSNVLIGTAENAGNYRGIFSNSSGGGAFIGVTNQTGTTGDRAVRMGFGSGATVATIQGTSINVADNVNISLQAGGGNVLIGTTTNTGSRLGIKSSSTNSFPLIVQRSANTNTLAAISETSGGDGSFLLANSLGSTNIQLLSNGTSILNGGNVLIGTTNDPGATLHVNGTIRTGQLPGAIQNAVNWRLGTARGGPVTSNATVRVEIDGVLVDLLARYV